MDVFSDDAKVKLIYIQDAVTSRQQVIYQGDITGFRNHLSMKYFNGFDNGQQLTIVDVKVINKFEALNKDSIITNVIYYVEQE